MKKFVSIALVLVMILALGTASAFADGKPVDESHALEDSFLRKDLNVADGVNIDSIKTFKFIFTKVGSDTAPVADHPTIAAQTVQVVERSNDLATGAIKLSDIFQIGSFPHAGEYVWSVKEDLTTPVAPDKDKITETLTMDQSEYLVHIFVINTADGLAFQGVIVTKDGEKVDPTEIPETHPKSEFLFENTYKELIENPLAVNKSITGSYADMTKKFPVSVEIEIPGSKVASKADVLVAEGATITWTDDTHATVSADLGDGDSIVFTQLPAGTTFVVKETQDPAYQSKTTGYVQTEDTDYVTGNVDKAGKAPITASGNQVNIENNRADLIPTGVIIDNLPYVLLVLVAVAGVAYITLKKKAYDA